jgi:hypothetical protein
MASLVASDAPAVYEARSSELTDLRRPAGGWLLGPWYDALLIANVGWPLLLLLQWGEGFDGREGVQFWQIYFLTTPHRWITLGLVFFDRQRMRERGGLFLAIAAAVVVLCLGVRMTTGTLMCLLTIDYVWNAWHFASQHHGVYRIYARLGDGAGDTAVGIAHPASGRVLSLEKWSMRVMLLYVILRVAGATWTYPRVEQVFQVLDWVAIGAAAWLAVRECTQPRRLVARSLYLGSMLSLYVGLLLAVHFQRPGLVLSLATASAMFHATEYLALVTWSVRKREGALPGGYGLLSFLAGRWSVVLVVFVVVLGMGGWMMQQHLLKAWLTLNVIVAFLHYAYDGFLWRRGGGVAVISQARPVVVSAS